MINVRIFDFVETTEEIQELKREMIKNKSKASHNVKRWFVMN